MGLLSFFTDRNLPELDIEAIMANQPPVTSKDFEYVTNHVLENETDALVYQNPVYLYEDATIRGATGKRDLDVVIREIHHGRLTISNLNSITIEECLVDHLEIVNVNNVVINNGSVVTAAIVDCDRVVTDHFHAVKELIISTNTGVVGANYLSGGALSFRLTDPELDLEKDRKDLRDKFLAMAKTKFFFKEIFFSACNYTELFTPHAEVAEPDQVETIVDRVSNTVGRCVDKVSDWVGSTIDKCRPSSAEEVSTPEELEAVMQKHDEQLPDNSLVVEVFPQETEERIESTTDSSEDDDDGDDDPKPTGTDPKGGNTESGSSNPSGSVSGSGSSTPPKSTAAKTVNQTKKTTGKANGPTRAERRRAAKQQKESADDKEDHPSGGPIYDDIVINLDPSKVRRSSLNKHQSAPIPDHLINHTQISGVMRSGSSRVVVSSEPLLPQNSKPHSTTHFATTGIWALNNATFLFGADDFPTNPRNDQLTTPLLPQASEPLIKYEVPLTKEERMARGRENLRRMLAEPDEGEVSYV